MVIFDDTPILMTPMPAVPMQVAVPYWYYVKGLGRKIIRYSKIMAHDEDNTANVSHESFSKF